MAIRCFQAYQQHAKAASEILAKIFEMEHLDIAFKKDSCHYTKLK